MEFLYRLLDRLDTCFTAGLVGAFAASWWHRDDLVDRKAWAVFIFSGAVCGHYLTGLVSAYLGVVEPRNRNAGAIVRTAVQHVATQARMETLKENPDVVQAVEWVSGLSRSWWTGS
ncbi:hypothetical protein PPC_2137 [Pseudomonas protegens Cab57]|nr:hypothetical protein PPC_2137 [Pseudomonas protegens Cab57]